MATRQLFVLRHAKSSWDDPGLRDHERPLSARGRRAAQLVRQHLHSEAIEPALVLCSSARRAVETLHGVNPASRQRSVEPELYAADASAVLERLRRIPEDISSLMVIGHNPAMQVLILRLAADGGPLGETSDLAQVRRKFPTGALATIEFDCAWSELEPGRGRLTALARPKQL
jgi:phosphohistidine phosphatase